MSPSFKTEPGRVPHDIAYAITVPGPGEYQSKPLVHLSDSPKVLQQFGYRDKRFSSNETLSPGPGQYVLPSTVIVKDKKHEFASYRSNIKRDLEVG